MKLMIASDLHGDIECTKKLVDTFYRSGAEKLVLLGDILYHGPRNDLPAGYAPKEVIALLNSMKNDILCVRGNCDTEVDQMVLEFPILADYAYLFCDGVRIFATHGHNHNMNNATNLSKGDILLHGHTHIPAVIPFGDGNIYINPGSVSLPKENSPKSYMIFENGVFSFRNLESSEEYKVYKI